MYTIFSKFRSGANNCSPSYFQMSRKLIRSRPWYNYAPENPQKKRRITKQLPKAPPGWRPGMSSRPRPLLQRLVRSEIKGVDLSLNNMSVAISDFSNNANIVLLNGISPGTGSFNRVGRQVALKSLRWTGKLSISRTGGLEDEAPMARMLLVWDAQPSGLIPIKGSILGQTSQMGVETTSVYDHIRYDNTSRFKILKDELIILNLTGELAAGELMIQSIPFDWFIDLTGKNTLYSGQSTPCNIADISSGALYLINMTDIVLGEGNACNVSGVARLRYTD